MTLNVFLKRLLGMFGNKYKCRKLQRSNHYQAKYNAWLQCNAFTELSKNFYKAYHYKKAGMQCQYRVELLQEQYRQGIVLFYHPQLPIENFSFLFDFLKDQVMEQGYQLHSSNYRKLRNDNCLQQTETYQLTPKPTDLPGTKLCNQLYGNILIELTSINRKPGFIRLTATTFPDSHFSEPLPFDELLKNMLHPTENH
ncbi:hypothetical protein WG947_00585 [Pontibacter sp. H259]|uniref:hypothetical protein n=1 Tax=Pontibacter sp. H259 TaxID=3133421 RepID=UPI0030C19CDB